MTEIRTSLRSPLRSPLFSPLVGRWGRATPTYLPTVGSAPQAVYGTTKLIASYAGSCLQVQRASDASSQDIGFVNGAIDMASAVVFAAGSELTVAKWYDQSGNGNDAVNATTANQPRLRPANAWRGLQGITFDGFAQVSGGTQIAKTLAIPAGVTVNRQASTDFVVQGVKASYNSNASVELGTTSVTRALLFSNVATSGQQVHLGSGSTPTVLISSRWARMNPSLNGFRLRSGGSEIYTDVTTDTLTTASAGTATGGQFGTSVSGATFNHRGEMFAFVHYAAALSDADASAVKTALNAAYGLSYSQTSLIVVEGDSISEGTSDTYGMNNIRQALPYISKDPHVYNMAVHGTTAAVEYPRRAAKFAGLTQASATKKAVLFGLGSNDIANGTTASTLWTTLNLPYIQYLIGLGYAVVVGTIISRDNVGLIAGFQTEYLTYNQLVRDNAVAQGYTVADYAALPEFDAQADCSNTTYYFTDKTHPTSAGYAKMAAVSGPLLNVALT